MVDRLRLGRSLRAIRVRLGLRQSDLAARSGTSRSFVSAVERGVRGSVDLTRLGAIAEALGADLDVRFRWRGEGLDRLLDEGHAALFDATVALLRRAGWAAWLEATFNVYGDRGSVDVLGWHEASRSILVVEVKSVVADAQGTLAPLDRKVRHAVRLGHERGVRPERVGRLLVVADLTTNRRRIARFAALFAAALPARGRAVRRWLATPDGQLSGLLFLPDSAIGDTRRSIGWRSRVTRRRPRQQAAE